MSPRPGDLGRPTSLVWDLGSVLEDQIPIRLYADYVEWPLWGPAGPLSEDELPISTKLRHRIRAWFSAFDRPREGWPLWKPPAGTRPEQIEDAWAAEGKAIGALLQGELGPRYLVSVEL